MKFSHLLFALTCLSGCALHLPAPDESVSLADEFSAPIPDGAAALDIEWWSRNGDVQLAELLAISREASPDLRTAAANVIAARANARQTSAVRLPSVNGTAAVTESGGSGQSRSEDTSVLADASWEVDIFGKRSSSARSDRARQRSEELSYAGAYVSLAAEVADNYIQYRACRLTENIYGEAWESQRSTVSVTEDLVRVGFQSRSDLSLARANEANALAAFQDQRASCELISQTLALAVGSTQASVKAILAEGEGLPEVTPFEVTSIPSDAIRQRPDIAAAEQDLKAAMLDVRVAKADRLPSLSLSGTITLTDPTSWGFGPTLSLPIFDAGQRAAAVEIANANAMIAAEAYRSAVLNAVQEIESALTRLDVSSRNLKSTAVQVDEYRAYFDSVDEYWRAGGVSLLDREQARRQLQSAMISQVSQQETVLRQWIALYKAIGGGWDREDLDITDASRG